MGASRIALGAFWDRCWSIWGTLFGAENDEKIVFEGLAKPVACGLDFLSQLKAFLDQFWIYFGMLFGMFFRVVDACMLIMRQPEKYCIFQRALHGTRVFTLLTTFRKSLRFSMKKLRTSLNKNSANEKPCPTPLWRAFWLNFGSILVP